MQQSAIAEHEPNQQHFIAAHKVVHILSMCTIGGDNAHNWNKPFLWWKKGNMIFKQKNYYVIVTHQKARWCVVVVTLINHSFWTVRDNEEPTTWDYRWKMLADDTTLSIENKNLFF